MIKGDKQQGEEDEEEEGSLCVCVCVHLHMQPVAISSIKLRGGVEVGVGGAWGTGEILPPYYCGYRVDLATGPRCCSTSPALLEPH